MFKSALLMVWMPPPDGIAMCQCDECKAITGREDIHAANRAIVVEITLGLANLASFIL